MNNAIHDIRLITVDFKSNNKLYKQNLYK